MLTIRISRTVLMALSLDDTVMQAELRVGVQHIGISKQYDVSGKPDDLRVVLDDIYNRGLSANVTGYDQPRSWRDACRKAWPRVRQQVEAQGYDVTTERRTVRIKARELTPMQARCKDDIEWYTSRKVLRIEMVRDSVDAIDDTAGATPAVTAQFAVRTTLTSYSGRGTDTQDWMWRNWLSQDKRRRTLEEVEFTQWPPVNR